MGGWRRAGGAAACAAAMTLGLTVALAGGDAVGAAPPSQGYRAGDYADGRAMNILPPGANGLVSPLDLPAYLLGKRPKNSQDQLDKYKNLLYGRDTVTDATLGDYYNDASFGVKPGDVVRTDKPAPGVTILRDKLGVPHVYGDTDAAAAFGAGYAQAQDRLFLMDVLRHYGSGTLASFLGASCEFQQMDHDQLLLAPYTKAAAIAQVDALPARYGAQGTLARTMIYSYVDGVNKYIGATRSDLRKLPADYVAAVPDLIPQKWTVADVVSIAGLIGGIFGRGGGGEVANARLLQYLQRELGTADGARAFTDLRRQNDPLAPTTVTDKAFPYAIPGTVDPAKTAIPDGGPLTGAPKVADANCNLAKPNLTALNVIAALQNLPKHMSNALVVNGSRTADGHPVAVFGPQVSYYAPQILSQLDLHSPSYHAAGASFPGTGLVELGRGQDYAWSATSANSDIIDQRIEKICDPAGGTPAANGTYYEFRGQCLPMTSDTFTSTVLPKPGGLGAPAIVKRTIHQTRHGIVQGWTTVGGKPVAVVSQRSTYGHDVDSVVGFLGFGQPALNRDVTAWMQNAAKINFTFNWFYADDRDTGYYLSGLDPIRPADVDPALPTWGTGEAEWTGYLADDDHVHEVNPAQGYFVSWNNKPAPGFSAADNQFSYGQTYRSVMLVRQLENAFARTGNKVTRADVVRAMATAASQDLDGLDVVPLLLDYASGRPHSAGVEAMLTRLRQWVDSGAHRRKAKPADTQYAQAAAVAISDELMPQLTRALFDRLLEAGGVATAPGGTATKYSLLPMSFVNSPHLHLGSAYADGVEGYLMTALQQLLARDPADAFGPAVTGRLCTSGPTSCPDAVDSALQRTYEALVTANRSADVSAWTATTETAKAKQTMPRYDAIEFKTLGLVGQAPIDWQNRPTFQQVVSFPRHRDR